MNDDDLAAVVVALAFGGLYEIGLVAIIALVAEDEDEAEQRRR